MALPLAGIIARLGGLAKAGGRGALAGMLGSADDGLDAHAAALRPGGEGLAGRGYSNPMDPATPPVSRAPPSTGKPKDLETASEDLSRAVEAHGKEISEAIARLERALKATLSARRSGTRKTVEPTTTATGEPAEDEGGSGFWAGVAGAMGGKGKGGIRRSIGRVKARGSRVLDSVKGRLGRVAGSVGTVGKVIGGGVLGTGVYMGGEWLIDKATRGLGEAIHGKEAVDRAERLLAGEPDVPAAGLAPAAPVGRSSYESRIIRFVASKMAFDFDRVTGIHGVGRGGAEDDSGDGTEDLAPDGSVVGPEGSQTDFSPRHKTRAGFDELTAPSGTRPLQTPKKDGEVGFDPSKPDVSERGLSPFSPPGLGGTQFKSPVQGKDINDPASVPFSGGSKNSRSFGGRRGNKLHTGVDIPGNVGDPILAVKDGVVRRAEKSSSGYGWTVDVEYPDGTIHRNAHMNEIADGIEVGSKVKAGQSLGGVGHSGNADAGFPHNHYEVIKKDYYDSHGGRPPGRAESEEELHSGRIDPREYYAAQHSEDEVESRLVRPTPHARNYPAMPDRFYPGGPPQPQGEFVGSAAPYRAPPPAPDKERPKTIIRRPGQDDEPTGPGKVRKRKFVAGDNHRETGTFSDYLGVGGSEVGTGE